MARASYIDDALSETGQEADLSTYRSSSYNYDEGHDTATFGHDETTSAAATGGFMNRRNKLLLALVGGSAFLCAISTGGAAAYTRYMARSTGSGRCLIEDPFASEDLVSDTSSAKSFKPTRRALEGAGGDEAEAILTSTGADYADLAKTLEERRENLNLGERKKQRQQHVRRLQGTKSSKAPGGTIAPLSSGSKGGKSSPIVSPIEVDCTCAAYFTGKSGKSGTSPSRLASPSVSGAGKGGKSGSSTIAPLSPGAGKSGKSGSSTIAPLSPGAGKSGKSGSGSSPITAAPTECMVSIGKSSKSGTPSTKSSKAPSTKSTKATPITVPAPLPAPLPNPPTPEPSPEPTPPPTQLIIIDFPTAFPKVEETATPTVKGTNVTVGEEATAPPEPAPIREEITTLSPTAIVEEITTLSPTSESTVGVTITVSTETTGPPTLPLRESETEGV